MDVLRNEQSCQTIKMNHSRCKIRTLIWAVSIPMLPGTLCAQLEFKPSGAQQTVFAGDNRPVTVEFHNPAQQPTETALRTQLYQAGSATIIRLGDPRDWKKLEVLPGQTVLESTPLDFPSVREATPFLVQWLDEKSTVLGKTLVMVYPTNILRELIPLAGNKPLGIFDPHDMLKPLLKRLDVEFEDLALAGVASFSGRLAIIGQFESKDEMDDDLSDRIRKLAKRGKAVVWLQAPAKKHGKILPTFYSVPEGSNATVIVQPEMVVDLPENPQAQLNLIFFCQLALHPQAPVLPNPLREDNKL